MGESQAYLSSDLPLRRMIDVLERASWEVRPAVSAAQEALVPRLRRLDRELERLRDKIRSAERWLDHVRQRPSDEDDDGSAIAEAEACLDEAYDHLRSGEAVMETVFERVSRFRHAAAALDSTPAAIRRAQDYLREQLEALGRYRAVALNSTPTGPPPQQQEPPQQAALYLPSLPTGFAWVPVAAIDEEQLSLGAGEWRKVDRGTMEAGVKRFFDELVPLMHRRLELTKVDLERMDLALGRVDQSGLVHDQSLAYIFDVFFSGGEPMAGWQDENGRWHLHNGRHRASIARDLNYTHVPVKITNG